MSNCFPKGLYRWVIALSVVYEHSFHTSLPEADVPGHKHQVTNNNGTLVGELKECGHTSLGGTWRKEDPSLTLKQ